MSHIASAWAWKQKTGSPSDKAVLMFIADASNEHGKSHETSWHKQETIAAFVECSVDTVRRALARLEANGFIKREPQYADRGYRLHDVYYLLMDRPAGRVALPPKALKPSPGKLQGPENRTQQIARAEELSPSNLPGPEIRHQQIARAINSDPADCGGGPSKLPVQEEPVILTGKEKDRSSLRSESSDAVAPDLELIADAPRQDKPTKSPYTQEFNDFWGRCPQHSKRGSKADAFKAWRGLNGCRPLALEAVDAWNRAETARIAKSREPDAESKTPHVSTWLRGRRWETLAEVKQDRAARAAHAKTFAYPLAQDSLEEQLRILRVWQEGRSTGRHTGWMASFGPEPGHPDCKIPVELLAKAGISLPASKLNGQTAENHAMLAAAS